MFGKYVYWDGRNGVIPKPVKILRYRINPNRMKGLYNIRFIDDALMHTCTSLIFPPKATDYREKQAQEMKYYHCVNTIAKLFQKYAPKVLH